MNRIENDLRFLARNAIDNQTNSVGYLFKLECLKGLRSLEREMKKLRGAEYRNAKRVYDLAAECIEAL